MQSRGLMLLLVLAGCQIVSPGRGAGTTGGGAGPSGGGHGGGGGEAAPSAGGADADGMVVVPNLVGKSFVEANAMVRQAGFRPEIEQTSPVECDTAPPGEGLVRCQDPEPGKRVRSYTMLHVNVYHKPSHYGRVTLEDLAALKGMTVAQAKAKLVDYGFTGEVVVYHTSNFIEGCKPDVVCRAESAGGIMQLYLNEKAAAITLPPPE